MNMKKVYELKIYVDPVDTSLFFDSEDAASKTLQFLNTFLTEEAKKTFTHEGIIHEVYSADDIKEALIQVFDLDRSKL